MRLPCSVEEFLFPPPWDADGGGCSFRLAPRPRDRSRRKPLWFRLLLGLEVVALAAILGWLALEEAGGTSKREGFALQAGAPSATVVRPARF